MADGSTYILLRKAVRHVAPVAGVGVRKGHPLHASHNADELPEAQSWKTEAGTSLEGGRPRPIIY